MPSLPTSRATRVTSSANVASWSTIVFTVSLSSATSPLTSTVTFRLRSPWATAVVTSAMFRTCEVRFEAIWLTESVRSFQTPETPFTRAWPPSFPSVPTSRATRVTSAAKAESWSTIALTVEPIRANSPFTGCPAISSTIFWERSPCATASSTRPTSRVGRERSSISELSASSVSAQKPVTPCTFARVVRRPSRPTTLLTRTSSLFVFSRVSASSLNARPSSPTIPALRVESRTPCTPSLLALSAFSSGSRSCVVRPQFFGAALRAARRLRSAAAKAGSS